MHGNGSECPRGHSETSPFVPAILTNLSLTKQRENQTNLCVAENRWPDVKRGEHIRLFMRLSDSVRSSPFARVSATAGRDFKMARDLSELIGALNVTPREFAAAVVYHELWVHPETRQGYKQWWPNFVMNFEPIVQELRKGVGKTKREMIDDGKRRANLRTVQDDRLDYERARAEAAPAEVAAKYVQRLREMMNAKNL